MSIKGSTEKVNAGKTAVDDDGEPISVWNPDNEQVVVGKEVKEIELFYSGGDICDVTGKPREVVVRLKVM